MKSWSKWAASVLTLVALQAGVARAENTEPRLALVIGESAYTQNALPTAANDAGLIASTLSNEGFDVTGARDLDDDALRKSFREFLDKAQAAGPNAVVFVYIAGQGLQLQGENYLVPVGASVARDTDVPVNAFRLSDFTRALDAIPLKARIVVLDAAHANDFAKGGQPLATGLAMTDPAPGSLIAYNATPDTVAPAEGGTYGTYATALNEMLRQAGLPLDDVFNETRLRVNEQSKGAITPWDTDKVTAPFVFLERGQGAPAQAVSADQRREYDTRPIREFPVADAYYAALERDTVDAYQDFLAAFPASPQAQRVRWLLAVRREATIWRFTYHADTPNAYWTYLRRYPDGPHAADARRRLAQLRAELNPPQTFEVIEYDVPPPPPEEVVIINRPVVIYEVSAPPPPPPPVYFVEPERREVIERPEPEPGAGRYILPLLPVAAAIATIPLWAHVPRAVPQRPRAEGQPRVRPPQFVQQNPGGSAAPQPGQPPVRGQQPPGQPVPGQPIPNGQPGAQPGVPPVHTLPAPAGQQPGVQPGPAHALPVPAGQQPGQPPLPGAPKPGVPAGQQPGAHAPQPVPQLQPGHKRHQPGTPAEVTPEAPGGAGAPAAPVHVMPAPQQPPVPVHAPQSVPQVHVPAPAAPVHVAPPAPQVHEPAPAAPVHVAPPVPQVHVPPPAAPVHVPQPEPQVHAPTPAPHPEPAPGAHAPPGPGGHPPGGAERRCGHPGEPPCH